jgi:outer membrane receptor protein involved in Fe transport
LGWRQANPLAPLNLISDQALSIGNLLNTDPAVAASGPAGSAYTMPPTNQALFDLTGRTFRLGLRFEM